MAEFNIDRHYLSDVDADRLYAAHPKLKASYKDYCPTCAKAGSYRWKGEEVQCDCRKQLNLHKHYLAAGVGVTYQRLSWDDYEGDEAVLAFCAKYVDKAPQYVARGVGVVVHGSFGSGKTLAMNLLVKQLIHKGYNCYATTFASMIEMFTAGWRSPEEQRWFQRKIVQSDVLLLDDLGRELRTNSKLSESTFDDVLRTRVQAGKVTFITTNLTPGEMKEGYGAAVLSLLQESAAVLSVSGSDFRPQAKKRMIDEVAAGEVRPIF